jgi:hypothetical protein
MAKQIKQPEPPSMNYFDSYRSKIKTINDKMESLLETTKAKVEKLNADCKDQCDALLEVRNKIGEEFLSFKKDFKEIEESLKVNKSSYDSVKNPTKLTKGFYTETERLLEINGKPIHLNEIMRANELEVNPKNTNLCFRRLTTNDKFRNEGKNTWALSIWPKGL